MTLTLLIDLDDTLLSNSMETFVPAYLQKLGGHLARYADPDALGRQLLSATKAMIKNDNPSFTLKQVFDQKFYPVLGLDYNEVKKPIDDFYLEVFPSLSELTERRQEAVDLVKEALSCGYSIAVATNPMFPLTAIQQRLAWAGLDTGKYPFRLVPSYSSFHFAKPNPAYFAEFLGQLGWPEGPVVMVGNDKQADILPAREFGLATFWVTELEEQIHRCSMDGEPPWASGGLGKLLPWIHEISPDNLQPRLNTPAAISATLKSTPAAIASLLDGLEDSRIINRPLPREWSILETLCHLRDVDREVFLPRIEKVLTETNAMVSGVIADAWAEERKYRQQDPRQVLADFTQARMELLEIISGFNSEDWMKTARHIDLGPTSMKELLKISARHDRLHIQIIYSLLYLIQS
jgi:FMN phosphatase YigB (HAD superfamily)